jgi:hypothetical protein
MCVQNKESNCHHANGVSHWQAGTIGTFERTVGVRARGAISLHPNKSLSIKINDEIHPSLSRISHSGRSKPYAWPAGRKHPNDRQMAIKSRFPFP